jgi:hypothetical protein
MRELAKIEKPAPYRKYTQEQIIAALEESHGLIAPAARALGCSRDTIRSYIEEYPEVARAKEDMREVVKDIGENGLIAAAKRGEPWAICFLLKCLAKDRGFVEKAEITGPGGGPVTIRLVYDE